LKSNPLDNGILREAGEVVSSGGWPLDPGGKTGINYLGQKIWGLSGRWGSLGEKAVDLDIDAWSIMNKPVNMDSLPMEPIHEAMQVGHIVLNQGAAKGRRDGGGETCEEVGRLQKCT